MIVLNHGIHWQNCGQIVDIDLENDTTMIKWKTTKKSESVSFEDLQKISIDDKSLRKCKPMDFFLSQPDTKIPSNMLMEEEIQNKYYSSTNSSKLCAEGAIVNLMNVVNCSDDDMKLFWSIVCDQSMQSVCEKLQVMSVPKIVHKTKSLWILCKKFMFHTTTRMKESSFQNLQNTMNFLSYVKFPVIIAVKATHACYHHVIVVWKGIIIDYESKYTYSLTNESLTQICSKNTTFHGISRDYGIFLPRRIMNLPENAHIDDWGYTEWCIPKSQIRKYFV